MDNTSYILASREIALFKQQDRIADQVANANTVAFKGEKDVFAKHVLDGGNAGPLAFTEIATTTRDNSQGPLKRTERPLDVAIQGDAYMMVETPLGNRYTRAGNFTIDANGDLVTPQGYRVMGPGGQQTNFAPEDTNIVIREDGVVTANGGETRGQIGLFHFDHPESLERVGSNLYRTSVTPQVAEDSKLAQGMLEDSNVNSMMQMTDLINVSRGIEMASKTLDRNHQMELDAIKRIAQVN